MSVINEPLATPSRVRGVYRLLLHTKNYEMDRDILEEALSPPSIAAGVSGEEDREEVATLDNSYRNRIRKVVNEMIKMGLLEQQDRQVKLTESAIPTVGIPEATFLPEVITRLFFNQDNDANHDFATLTAWFYSQNVYEPMSWSEISKALEAQTNTDRLGCKNKTRFEQYEYWANYLGFSWTMTIGKTLFVTDPSLHLKTLLPKLFVDSQVQKYKDILPKLAKLSPIFEDGYFRKNLNNNFTIETRGPFELSSTTAFAWLRLQDQGYIELDRKSDADMFLFPEAKGQQQSYSGVRWTGKEISE